MPVVELAVRIEAPADRVFDLSRSVELHVQSTAWSQERAVAGVTTGLLSLHDQVTWEAVHFGVRQRLTSRIMAFDRPRYFRDSMIEGAFRRFDHDHFFDAVGSATVARDRFDFDSPLGALGRIVNALVLTRYMRTLLERRLETIKRVAESHEWSSYLVAG
jgi:ligand-binding SRPBCC domain-containing protein